MLTAERLELVGHAATLQTRDGKASPVTSVLATKDDVPYSVQFRQPSSDQVNPKLISKVIKDGVADLFGDYGSGKIASSLFIKYFSPATSTMIIRVSRDHYRLVWTALTYVTRLPQPVDQVCVMQVVRVSGTIRKAEEEAIRRARLSIRCAQKVVARSKPGATSKGVDQAHFNDDDDLIHNLPTIADVIDVDDEDEGSASED
nr:ribonuclease p/mrp protein subunit pop5 [Quercus suber]